MFEKLIVVNKSGQTPNLISQVVEILAGKIPDAATLKFISQMKTGNIFDAVFTGKTPEGKGIFSLEGNKIIVELPNAISFKKQLKQSTRVPLFIGQLIQVRVESSWPKPTLKIIPPLTHPDQTENPETRTVLTNQAKSISRLSRVESFSQKSESPKHLVSALITSIIDSKSIMVDTGGKSIVVPVENSELLKPGTKVSISFDKIDKGQSPTLVNTNTTSTKRVDLKTIIPYLSARMPIAQMASLLVDEILDSPVMQELNIKLDVVTRLRDTLNLLIPREGETPSEGQVRQQVESSGINYEAKVRQVLELGLAVPKELSSDLKGLLLELYQTAGKVSQSVKNPGPLADFRQTVKFAIDNIELNQLSSQISKQESQPLVIQIPNPLISGNKTIQLYIRKDSPGEEVGDKNKKNSHNVAFFLDLSCLGKIKINAQIGQERLSVKIDVESESIASFVSEKTQNFKKKMGEHNIKTSVECCAIDKVKPLKDNLIELLISHKTSLVNIKT